ncbi:MAG TPA: tyrosine-type recombinase/integrase [Chloroflexota bacterium]|nr:tyrosine-type recombinase/integrase [Chloroflexota bacterium]
MPRGEGGGAGPRIHWERLPLARELPTAREWLLRAAGAGLAPATLDAYSRAVERYLAYCRQRRIRPGAATTEHLAAYLRELSAAGLGPAARLQRLTALRLFYAFVVERGLRPDNPAAGAPTPPLVGSDAAPEPPLPWVPDEAQWLGVLDAAGAERPRSRVMLGLAYDGALRREELCQLRVTDVDLHRQLLRVPGPAGADAAQTAAAPGAVARVVPISPTVAERCADYLRERARLARRGRDEDQAQDGALFLSESPRNRARPITIWTWSKVVQAVARRAGVEHFTTHTPRHLRLTDLARAGRSAAEIARFAGHSRAATAVRYLRLAQAHPVGVGASGRDILRLRAEQLARVLFRQRRTEV